MQTHRYALEINTAGDVRVLVDDDVHVAVLWVDRTTGDTANDTDDGIAEKVTTWRRRILPSS
jgi:hypothetical protein